MTSRQQAYHRQAHHFRLASNRSVERHLQFIQLRKRLRRGTHYCHCTLLNAEFSSIDDQNNGFAYRLCFSASHQTKRRQGADSNTHETVGDLWKTRQKCFPQPLANGCFVAKLLILLLVSARNADTME